VVFDQGYWGAEENVLEFAAYEDIETRKTNMEKRVWLRELHRLEAMKVEAKDI
jgi:hypothetical protein